MIPTNRIINQFGKRVAELIRLSSTDSLPQWTDADTMDVSYLLGEYRKLAEKDQQQKSAVSELRNRLAYQKRNTQRQKS